MPAYSISDPAVLAFIVLPLVVVALFVWGVGMAWRRAGASAAEARRAAIRTAGAAAAWMVLTDAAARCTRSTNEASCPFK